MFNWVAVRIRVTTRQINTFIVAAWPKSSLDNLKRADNGFRHNLRQTIFRMLGRKTLLSDISIRSSCHLAVSTVKYKGHVTSTHVALSAARD